jgi:multidrug resistance efflux pump
MLELLLIIYGLTVWLVFFKFKLLPWNFQWKVIVFTTPVFGLFALVLLINVFQPVSKDLRALRYVVQVVPRVSGRVIDVPIEANRPIEKGDVLFRIEPAPYEYEVRRLRAALAQAEAGVRELEEQVRVERSRAQAVAADLALTEIRVRQLEELVAAGAGDRFELERYQADRTRLRAELVAAQAAAAKAQAQLDAQSDGEQAQVAQTRAELEKAEWNLSETVVTAPTDGFAVNLAVRPGSYAVPLPLSPVMTFIEEEGVYIATFAQNALHQVKEGDEAELTFDFYPGRIFKAKVHSVVQAVGQGQVPLTGNLPEALPPVRPTRLAVRFTLEPGYEDVFVPGGARGKAAIYTEHLSLIEIVRKVILRLEAKFKFIVLELHLPGGH